MKRLIRIAMAGCLGLVACGEPPPAESPNPPEREPLVRGGASTPRKHNFLGTFTPSTATWTLKRQRPGWPESAAIADSTFGYGASIDTPLVGDWDGNGTETQGIFRPQGSGQPGFWALANTLGGGVSVQFFFGLTGDKPVVGDWDGNGTTTPGTFRNGTFRLRNSNSDGNPDVTFNFGATGDIPLAGDWNGDGVDTIGVYRPSTSTFLLRNANQAGSADITLTFGAANGIPVVGDWDEDGVSSIGVVAGNLADLTNNLSSSKVEIRVPLGASGQIPVVGNFNPGAPTGFSTTPASLVSFFPLGIWQEPSATFSTWKSRGINTAVLVPNDDVAQGDTVESWTAAANQQGLKMIRFPRPNPADDLSEGNLLAWFLQDEPDGAFLTPFPENESKYFALRSFSSTLPILVDMVGLWVLKPYFMPDPGDGSCDGIGDPTSDPANLSCYPAWLSLTDWAMHDFYPINWQNGQDVFSVARTIDKVKRWSPKPQFPFVEAGPRIYNPTSPAPTAAQMRAEIWLAIIHGARGITYFTHGFCSPTILHDCVDNMTPSLITEMTTQNQRITSLAFVLQTEINPPSVGFRGSVPLQATWREVTGTRFFIVLNGSANTLTNKSMTITGFTPTAPFIVVGENRTKPASTTITDNFGPYEVHIYRTP